MTTPANPAGELEPMTFAELRTALDTAGPVYDPLLGKVMDPDHVRFDRVRELCERRSELFANALDLSHIEPLSSWEMLRITNDAVERGFISGSMSVDLMGCNARFYGRRVSDGMLVHVLVQADFIIRKSHVKLVSHQASWMQTILRGKGPPEQTGIALPVVAGGQLYADRNGLTEPLWDTTFVQI
jgi:hypothetical protein